MCLGFGSRAVCAALLIFTAACGGSFSQATSDDGGAGAGDGGVGGDGSTVEAGAPSFCANAGTHFFCDDFDDRTGNVQGKWDASLTNNAPIFTLDTKTALSPPNDLLAALTKPGSTDGVQAAVAKKVGKIRDVTIAYDVFIDGYGNANDAGAAASSIAFTTVLAFAQPQGVALGLIDPHTAYVYENTGAANGISHQLKMNGTQTGIAMGKWVHVLMRVQLPGVVVTKGNVHVELDNAVVLDDSLSFTQNPSALDTAIDLGLLFPPGGTAPSVWSLHYDNVVLDRTVAP